jgi:large subunit ribosomal protein L21
LVQPLLLALFLKKSKNYNKSSIFALPKFKINSNMYAIVTIAGQQMKVSEGQKLFVHRLDAKKGDSIHLDQILLIDRDGAVEVGTPTLSGSINATVLADDVQGDKVIVFKKKRRKGYKVKRGHRQQFTQIQINSITA